MDSGATGVRGSKAAWNCVDCYASRVKTLLHGVHRWLIIDFHREPIEARLPLRVPPPLLCQTLTATWW